MNSNQVSPSLDGMCLQQAAQALRNLTAGQVLDPNACSLIFGPAAASFNKIVLWFWNQNQAMINTSEAWDANIFPASEALGVLLQQLAQGHLQPIVSITYTHMPSAAESLKEIQSDVEDYLVEYPDDGSIVARDPNYWTYAQDLDCAENLLNAAYDFLVAIYGTNPTIAPHSSSALSIVLGYLYPYKLSAPDLCAYVLLALAGLKRNDDWRRGTNQLKQKSEIVDFMQQNFALIPNCSNDQLRNTAIKELLNAGLIERPFDTSSSSNIANCAYCINAQVLAQLQHATNAYSAY